MRTGRVIQNLPLDVPDIQFIGSDLKPYCCHLTYRLTEAILEHARLYCMTLWERSALAECVRVCTRRKYCKQTQSVHQLHGCICGCLLPPAGPTVYLLCSTARTVILHLHCFCGCFNLLKIGRDLTCVALWRTLTSAGRHASRFSPSVVD